MTKPTTPAIPDLADYAAFHGGIQLSARVCLGFSRRNLQQMRCSCAVRARGQIWQTASAKSSKRPMFQTPTGEWVYIDRSESLSRNSIDLTALTKASPLPLGENTSVGLVQCADKVRNRAHCALEGLPNKVMAAEYQTVLPDEKPLAEELERTRRALEARRIGRAEGEENQA